MISGSFSTSFAQEIKTNILAPMSLHYEFFLPNFQGLEIAVQSKPSFINQKGDIVRVGLAYRKYRERKMKLLTKVAHQQRGRYMSVYARYSNVSHPKYEIMGLALGATTGIKKYIRKKYSMDLFLGGGFRPMLSTTNAVLEPKRSNFLELNVGISLGYSWNKTGSINKKNDKKGRND